MTTGRVLWRVFKWLLWINVIAGAIALVPVFLS